MSARSTAIIILLATTTACEMTDPGLGAQSLSPEPLVGIGQGQHSTDDEDGPRRDIEHETGGGSGGSQAQDPDEADSTGDGACVLPQLGTWCRGQLAVAMEIGCSDAPDPWPCYRTVRAQYEAGDPKVVQAADCDHQDPGCVADVQACAAVVGSADCWLTPWSDCMANAEIQGIGAADAQWTCDQIDLAY